MGWGPTSDDEMMILGLFFTLDTAGITTSNHLDAKRNEQLHVYPNPFSDLITFDLNDIQLGGSLTIFDVKGSEVLTQPIPANLSRLEVPTNNIQKGMYFYLIRQGSNIFQGKLVKR